MATSGEKVGSCHSRKWRRVRAGPSKDHPRALPQRFTSPQLVRRVGHRPGSSADSSMAGSAAERCGEVVDE